MALATPDLSLQAASQPSEGGRVLSIQSTVVRGYVGNKCAMLPLQLLGFEVDPIYSVQFSNHTGYPSFKGAVFDRQHLLDLLAGLSSNDGLTSGYTHLLTGYMGSPSMLEAVVSTVEALQAANDGRVVYVCDPVLGDEGRLYVPAEMVDAYRARIVPLASVLLPNYFEAELLAQTGSITTLAAGFAACEALHALGPHTVIITSMALEQEPDTVTLLASTRLPQAAGASAQRLSLSIPRLHCYYTGTGDLLAALLLGWMHQYPEDLASAVEKAVAGLQAVLRDTAAHCPPEFAAATQRTAAVCAARELRLVQNRAALVNPTVQLRCRPVPPSDCATAAGGAVV